MRKRYSCVLFHVHDTILHQMPTMAERAERMLKEMGIAYTVEEAAQIAAYCEQQTGSQAHLCAGEGCDDLQLAHKLAFHLSRLYPQKISTSAAARRLAEASVSYTLMPDVWHVLTSLKCRGVRLGALCTGNRSLLYVLEQLELTTAFDCVLTPEPTGSPFPEVKSIGSACARCGAAPAETLYVGAHPVDVIRAHEAGADAAWIPSNLWFRLPDDSADYLLHDLKELLNIV